MEFLKGLAIGLLVAVVSVLWLAGYHHKQTSQIETLIEQRDQAVNESPPSPVEVPEESIGSASPGFYPLYRPYRRWSEIPARYGHLNPLVIPTDDPPSPPPVDATASVSTYPDIRTWYDTQFPVTACAWERWEKENTVPNAPPGSGAGVYYELFLKDGAQEWRFKGDDGKRLEFWQFRRIVELIPEA